MLVEEVSLDDFDDRDDMLSGVDTNDKARINIPREVLEGSREPVRMASLLSGTCQACFQRDWRETMTGWFI